MKASPSLELPEPWKSAYADSAEAIRLRLEDFSAVPESEYFYELIFCILTPQSSAKNASQTIQKLKALRFFEQGDDPTETLRHPSHYIRFHNTKAKRLLIIREQFPSIFNLIKENRDKLPQLREEIRIAVPGFGLKESSHFLRNIGFTGYGILDRHILKHLVRLKVIARMPKSLTEKRYYSIEKKWKKYATAVGISIDELDLLFWSMETGEILK
jgi:N-glycosylase/DNA lyase